eukprot:1142707-Pelagomonas_calceolata.AAC.5
MRRGKCLISGGGTTSAWLFPGYVATSDFAETPSCRIFCTTCLLTGGINWAGKLRPALWEDGCMSNACPDEYQFQYCCSLRFKPLETTIGPAISSLVSSETYKCILYAAYILPVS